MEIKTKFSPGDEVWLMHNNEPISSMVKCIHIDAGVFNGPFEFYDVENLFIGRFLTPEELFPTEEELFEHLRLAQGNK